MDHSLIFARHFAQLVGLLLHEPGNTDDQKVALRALVVAAKGGSVNLSLHSDSLQSNGEVVDPALGGVTDVARRMKQHGLAMISVDPDAAAAHILGVARILAAMPTLDDGGAAAEGQRTASGAMTIRFAARPRMSQPGMTLSDMEFGDVLDDPVAEARSRATPRSSQSIPTPSKSHDAGLFAQFTAPRKPTESHEQLLKQLDAEENPGVMGNLLDDLVFIAESAARERKSGVVAEIMSRMLRREGAVESFETRRAFTMSLRRLSKPEALRCVATQLGLHPARREEYVAILARAGEDGATALIEQIVAMTHQRDRQLYYGALAQLESATPSLLRMLGDTESLVVCNAAEVLGELQVREAERPLAALLKHPDERVRRAANGALMRLGTARAMQAIQAGLVDRTPEIRSDAALALVMRKDGRTTATLLQALDAEKNDDVQAAFLLSLGKLATPEAVQRLIKGAEVERGLFKRKSSAYRVAAVHGLAEARTMEATDALRALQADKDAEVRDAANRAIARITRRPTTGERPAIT